MEEANRKRLLKAVEADNSNENLVELPLDEQNAWRETLCLLSTSANAEHLLRAIAEDKAERTVKHELIES